MNENDIHELAKLLIKQGVFSDWRIYGWLIFSVILNVAVTKWLASYLTETGKFKAMRDNFDLALQQLRETTKTAKSIEVSLSHQDWTSRELKTLRRAKLEELLLGVFDTRLWIEKAITNRPEEKFESTLSPLNKVMAISKLYFPELNEITDSLFSEHNKFIVKILSSKSSLIEIDGEIEIIKVQISATQQNPPDNQYGTAAELLEKYSVTSKRYVEEYQKGQNELFQPLREIKDVVDEFSRQSSVLMSSIIGMSPILDS